MRYKVQTQTKLEAVNNQLLSIVKGLDDRYVDAADDNDRKSPVPSKYADPPYILGLYGDNVENGENFCTKYLKI
jgi:hypothetical protein